MRRTGLAASLLATAALACTLPALADSPAGRSHDWDLQARPEAPHHPADAARPGRQALPGIAWGDVYLPRDYAPDRPAPLAVLLHGSGDRGRKMIDAFADLADLHGVILLAIDSEDYSWDLMVKGAQLRNTTQVPRPGDDIDRIDAALARAFDLYAVDPARVALVGFSDGAGYGLSLGANNADLFGTVIAFAPGLLTRVESEKRGRVFIAHGLQDRVLSPAPSRDIFAPALRELGFEVDLRLFHGRHEMPADLRAQAFAWWLHGPGPRDAPTLAR
jgi:phospholipase/carboxylesterase